MTGLNEQIEEPVVARAGLYTIYEADAGRIIRSGEHPDLDFLGSALDEGLALYEGEALDDRYWTIVDGEKVALETAVDMAALERELERQIDDEAEGIRSLFITNTPSQPAVYLAKEAEAIALMADLDLVPSLTPNLTLEAERIGETRFEVAVVILTQAQMWREISAHIENIRLGAKEEMRAATTEAGKRAAAMVDWSPITALAS